MNKLALCLAIALSCGADAMAGWSLEAGFGRVRTLMRELHAQNGALDQADRTEKYDNMSVSPFAFYRGTAHLYYRDLDAQGLVDAAAFVAQDAETWIQGDLHVQNFGSFDDDDGEVVFDLNDFDESYIASYVYDLWRATASLVLVGRENGFSDGAIEGFVAACAESYLDRLEDYRGNGDEKDARLTADNTYGLLDNFLADVEDDNSREEMLDDWTDVTPSGRRFDLALEDLAPVSQDTWDAVAAAIAAYKETLESDLAGDAAYFAVLDVAARLHAGTGSLGTPRYYVLIEGATGADDDDRILDVKGQGLPAVFPYLDAADQGRLLDRFDEGEQGCRVALAQRALLTDVDDHVGCLDLFDASYSARERSPYKDSLDTAGLATDQGFTELAEQWGWVLAIDHARADNDFDADLLPQSFEAVMHELTDGKHQEFRDELWAFAGAYADQVEIDYRIFLALRARGVID